MRVTAELLRAKGACKSQVDLFMYIFPGGTEITRELCVEHARSFDWDWAAECLLPEKQWADYEAKHAALSADYQTKCASQRANCEAKHAVPWADFKAERDLLLADYEAESAGLFASLADQVP